jgi:pimeloyl-ACP methyl ester carboxylesterase
MGDDIVKVMDAVGLDRAHVVGHAAGGNAGLALALDHPDRIGRWWWSTAGRGPIRISSAASTPAWPC